MLSIKLNTSRKRTVFKKKCSNRSNREKRISFFGLPKVVCNQGEEFFSKKVFHSSKERRDKWINAVNRVGCNSEVLHTRIRIDHFITGKEIWQHLLTAIDSETVGMSDVSCKTVENVFLWNMIQQKIYDSFIEVVFYQ
ncbi:uncharacterized protein LOC105844417 isoform X4 [Hydra vulgaris]|uniref:Uncharacterized protein LOC105844417 isoform X4 n=1 Tax=Hydra vulgaris TaxID=6087 RepID=A0ABM4CXY3_HYDVU